MKTKSDVKPVQGFYTATEVAALAGCSSLTIIRDVYKGKLKGFRGGGSGRPFLIAQGNVAEYLEQRKRERR